VPIEPIGSSPFSAIGAISRPQILLRVAERLLTVEHGLVLGPLGGRRRQLVDVVELRVDPLAIRMLRRELRLDLLVVDDAALGRVDQEDLARVQPLLHQHVGRRNVEHTHLGRHDHQVVLGDVVARRAQAVAIEHGADDGAVGERNRRRAVPRLHQRGVVLVERLAIGGHLLVAAPRLGDHHQDGVRQRAPRHHQQLEHVVEGGGVAAALRG
jgi:hypothetical protein